MSDLDEQQERLTLALYGGALAAVGVLLVAFIFYLQTIMPLIGQLNQALAQLDAPAPTIPDQSSPETPTDQPVLDTPDTQPAQPTAEAQVAPPHTQFLLLLAATIPGGLMIGWALGGSGLRGAVATAIAHLPLASLALALGERLTSASPAGIPPGVWFTLLLLLVPGLSVLLALLAQRRTPPARRMLLAAITALPLLCAALLVARAGWWIVPVTWVALPLVAIAAPALLDRSGLTEQPS
jgi:hypothetical protein